MIDNLVHGQHDEIDRHNLHNRAQPEHGGSCSHTDKAIFDNRRIHHAFLAKLLQEPGRDFIRSLEGTNFLTHQEHVLIAQEFLAQRIMQRLSISNLCHR